MSNSDSGGCFEAAYSGGIYISLPISIVSLVPCRITVVLVCRLKLHRIMVYSLALYQVLSAIEFSVVWIASGAFELNSANPIGNVSLSFNTNNINLSLYG